MTGILEKIYTAGFSLYLHGFSAINSWLVQSNNQKFYGQTEESGADLQVLTNAGITGLAKLFEDLRYPGANLADAALDYKDSTLYFHCVDTIYGHHPSFSLLEFYRDCKTGIFYDPRGMYPLLAEIRRGIYGDDKAINDHALEIIKECLNSKTDRNRALMDASVILAGYFPYLAIGKRSGYDGGTEEQLVQAADLFDALKKSAPVGREEQRSLLCSLLASANPGLGFDLLKTCGFIDEYWHELAILEEAEHNKEFHPEGNAWKHTMETFRYRNPKSFDLRLSLGLLLHDTGKPIAISNGSRRFDRHAELGVIQSRKFLERLGFNASLINDVCFLVKNHMFTAALPKLPAFRTVEIMGSALFPLLLELYRCDESSSFKGLDGYYESSAVYQAYLRNRKNPYRSADGHKYKHPKDLYATR